MRELDMGVGQRVAKRVSARVAKEAIVYMRCHREFFETNDGDFKGGRRPFVVRHHLAPHPTPRNHQRRLSEEEVGLILLLKFLIVEYPLRVPLNEDLKVIIDQGLGGRGREGRTMFERLLLAPKPDGLPGMRLGRRSSGGRGGVDGGVGCGGSHDEGVRWLGRC